MGTNTGDQITPATSPPSATRPNAAQRARSPRQLTSRMTNESNARNEAKIISASAASAKKSPVRKAFLSLGWRNVFSK